MCEKAVGWATALRVKPGVGLVGFVDVAVNVDEVGE